MLGQGDMREAPQFPALLRSELDPAAPYRITSLCFITRRYKCASAVGMVLCNVSCYADSSARLGVWKPCMGKRAGRKEEDKRRTVVLLVQKRMQLVKVIT